MCILVEGKTRLFLFLKSYNFSKNFPSRRDMNIARHDIGHNTRSELSVTSRCADRRHDVE